MGKAVVTGRGQIDLKKGEWLYLKEEDEFAIPLSNELRILSDAIGYAITLAAGSQICFSSLGSPVCRCDILLIGLSFHEYSRWWEGEGYR